MAITHETMSLMMQFGLFLIAFLGLVFKMTQKKK